MNAYEHIFHVLDTAVAKDEIAKAELRRYLQRLLAFWVNWEATAAMRLQ